jgi:hypothetical protein
MACDSFHFDGNCRIIFLVVEDFNAMQTAFFVFRDAYGR